MGGFGVGEYPDIEGDGPKPGEPPARPANDFDADGLTDDFERTGIGTDWRKADTDGDGLTDREEHLGSTDPLRADTDGDRLNDLEEQKFGTNPRVGDSDGDGIGDYGDEMVLQPTYNTGPSPFGSPPISAEEAAFRAQAGKGVDPFQVLPGSTTGASGGFIQMFPTPAGSQAVAPDAALAATGEGGADPLAADGAAADGAAADGVAPDSTGDGSGDAAGWREFDLDGRLRDLDLHFGTGQGADGAGGDAAPAGPDGAGGTLREEILARAHDRVDLDERPDQDSGEVHGDLEANAGADDEPHAGDQADGGDETDGGDEADGGAGPQGIRAPDPGEEAAGFVY